jgi:hypothetical protein
VLDVQPRLSASATGKSNDEIIYELADSILSKFPNKLNIEKAAKYMFQLDSMGRLNSLTTVLQQEVERFNKLITVIKVPHIDFILRSITIYGQHRGFQTPFFYLNRIHWMT